MTTNWLIDKSAIGRLHLATEAGTWAERVERGLVRISTVTRLEIGFSVRSGTDHRALFADPFRFDMRRTPNDHVAFGSVPLLLGVRASPDSNSPSFSTDFSIVCPVLPSSTRRSRRTGRPTSSAVTNACPFASRRAGPP